MPYSFRTYLQHLEELDEIERVKDIVDPLIEMNRLTKENIKVKGPALFFEQVKGSDIPVVSGILGTKERIYDFLGTDDGSFSRFFAEKCAVIKDFIPYRVDHSPCQELTVEGDDIDLGKFPLTTHGDLDGGRYITAGICIAQDVNTGARNCSFHRLKMQGKNRLGLWMAPFDLKRIVENYHQKGDPCPVAVVIGGSPYLQIAACTSIAPDEDEAALAGALQGEAVAMVGCRTIPLDVPAETEIVMEGWVMPDDELEEGPFGETSGYYSDRRMAPVITLSAITMRHDCIYQDIATGRPPDENQAMLITHQARADRLSKDFFPNIRKVCLTAGGCVSFNAAVQIEKRYPGEAKQIGSFLLSVLPRVKNIWLVDTDIDPGDPMQVEWAYATRCCGERDINIIKNTKAVPLEPCSVNGQIDKIVFDCTIPLPEETIAGQKSPVPCSF